MAEEAPLLHLTAASNSRSPGIEGKVSEVFQKQFPLYREGYKN